MSTWAARLDNPISARLRDPAASGFLGIVLGAFAAFLAIPPIEARTVTWPILVGIVAAMLGIWTVTRGRRRLGWGAVAAGILGIGLGILATRSSSANLGSTFDSTLVAQTLSFATPLVFAAIGTLLSAFLFGALLYGSFHGLGSSAVIDPQLASNLTYIIQGLIVLFIGADVLILYAWNSRKKLRWRPGKPAGASA